MGDDVESPTSDALRTFLAERDVPCPKCGYNLRGLSGPTCPECNTLLALDDLENPANNPWSSVPGVAFLAVVAFAWAFASVVQGYWRVFWFAGLIVPVALTWTIASIAGK